MRLILAVLVASLVPAQPPQAAPRFERVLDDVNWISYAPTHYYPGETPPVIPDDASLTADLWAVRRAGFTGLVTYGAQPARVPDVARKLGFHAMLLGIWDPSSSTERAVTLDAVRRHGSFIAGIVIGNEGLLTGRYTIDAVCAAMREVHDATGLPVSTTEPVDWVLDEPRIQACSTFVTVDAHPFFANRREPAAAVRWTEDVWRVVTSAMGDKPVLFKEVGLPTAGAPGMSPEAQRDYYVALARTRVRFAYFEAFDATARFKPGAVEQSWGLWTSDRQPKLIVGVLPWPSGSRGRP
jgi:exo-beta-1,3-glucanase (GH17 family)